MKKIKLLPLAIFLLLSHFTIKAQVNPASSCDNLDFRRGDFAGWVGRTTVYPANYPDANNCGPPYVTVVCPGTGTSCNGCYSLPIGQLGGGIPVPMTNPGIGSIPFYDRIGIVPGRHTIISTSTPDPFTCNNVMTLPPGEPFCARLGNGGIGPWGNGVGYQIDYLSYSFTVDPTNVILTYKYAIILQDVVRDPTSPIHTFGIRPRFVAKVRNAAGLLVDPLCGSMDTYYDTTMAGFKECSYSNIQNMGGTAYNPVGTAYRDWTTVSVDLGKYIGQKVTIEFNTWDCGWGEHFGYAYVSARCDAFKLKTELCTADGSVIVKAPEGFSYKWFPSGETTKDIKVFVAKPGDSVYVELTFLSGCKTTIGTRIYPPITKAEFNLNLSASCLKTIGFKDSSYSYLSNNNVKIPILNWKWYFGDGTSENVQNPSHTYISPGTYTVSLVIADESGCTDSVSKLVVVTGSTTPGIPTITQNGTLLTSSSPTGNQWYLNGTIIPSAINQDHQAEANGNYTVIVTANGCPSVQSAPIHVVIAGIAQQENKSLTIYPNPANDFIVVEGLSANSKVELYDLLGKKLFSQIIHTNDFKINISEFPSGIYFYKFLTGENSLRTGKIIKE